ncbi:MAG: HAD-IIB family hydrolase [Firmicutes bacterium]|nr:HAD-IIB family hydrolase [Bacillota bacterium]
MSKRIKLIGFDLDGTLTQHKTPIDARNRNVLAKLKEDYFVVMVAAGSCERVYHQLKEFPIDIIGNYGMQESTTILKSGLTQFKLIKNHKVPARRSEILEIANKIRGETSYAEFKGDTVEFHESGVITYPLLGTKASLQEKLRFDPDRSKRRKIYETVKQGFKSYNVFIGGSSSFDIVPKPYNKYFALREFAEKKNVSKDEILYVGDDFGHGGNDEPVLKSGIKCIDIRDYKDFAIALEKFL